MKNLGYARSYRVIQPSTNHCHPALFPAGTHSSVSGLPRHTEELIAIAAETELSGGSITNVMRRS